MNGCSWCCDAKCSRMQVHPLLVQAICIDIVEPAVNGSCLLQVYGQYPASTQVFLKFAEATDACMRPWPEGSLSTSDQVSLHIFRPHQANQILTPRPPIRAYLPSTCGWAESKGALLPAVPSPGETH